MPFLARQIAREFDARHPGLAPEEIGVRMRANIGRTPTDDEEQLVRAVVAFLAPAPAGAARPKRPSAWVLVAANLVPLAGVLFWDWSVFALIALFWMENVVVGVFFVLRLICAHPEDLAAWALKLFMVPFFCVHYGMFTAIHGIFVFSMLGGERYAVKGYELFEPAMRAATEFHLWLPVAVLFASHLFSFAWNYLCGGEFRRVDIGRLTLAPYARVVVLHVAILFGAFGAVLLGSPLWALLLLLALKIALDLKAHVKEHSTHAKAYSKGFFSAWTR